MKLFIFSLFLLSLHSCRPNDGKFVLKEIQKYADTSKDFQLVDSNETVRTDSPISLASVQLYDAKSVFKIDFKVLGEVYGHSFSFRQDGGLFRYLYFSSDEHYTYGVQYDYSNKVFTEIGTPYVGYVEDDSLDNRKIFFSFSTFPRGNLDISVSKDSINFKNVKLQQSVFMPLVKVYKYNTTKNESIIYFKITASKPLVNLGNLPYSVTSVMKVSFPPAQVHQ